MYSHRSSPVDQQNSASTVETTDQPEDPTAGTKRARMMPVSKIVLPSSDVEGFSEYSLRRTISRIVNPGGNFFGFSKHFFDFFVYRPGWSFWQKCLQE